MCGATLTARVSAVTSAAERGAGAGPPSTTPGSRQIPVRLRLRGAGSAPKADRPRGGLTCGAGCCTSCLGARFGPPSHSQASLGRWRCSWGYGLNGLFPMLTSTWLASGLPVSMARLPFALRAARGLAESPCHDTAIASGRPCHGLLPDRTRNRGTAAEPAPVHAEEAAITLISRPLQTTRVPTCAPLSSGPSS